MDFTRGCPGRDRSAWTADDIFEVTCSKCGAQVEFFKDDARRYCPQCGTCTLNPRREVTCADWCAAAEQCSVGREFIAAGEQAGAAEPPADEVKPG